MGFMWYFDKCTQCMIKSEHWDIQSSNIYHFFVLEIFKILFSSYFEIYNTLLLTIYHPIMLSNTRIYFFYLIVCLYPLTNLSLHPYPTSQPLVIIILISASVIFTFLALTCKSMWYLCLCAWIISLNVMTSSFICAAENDSISFLFMAK